MSSDIDDMDTSKQHKKQQDGEPKARVRSFYTTAKAQAVINAEARQWVLDFNHDRAPTKTQIAELKAWAARSPAHRQALEEAEALWLEADQLSQLAQAARRQDTITNKITGLFWSPAANQPRSKGYSRNIQTSVQKCLAPLLQALKSLRYPLTSAAVLATAALAFITTPINGNYYFNTVGDGSYSTAIGEQRSVNLRDRSVVTLDTNSQIQVTYNNNQRQIALIQGRAHFEVAKNPERPFEVYAGSGLVRAVGTAFSVYLDPQQTKQAVEVIVDEGKVALARTELPAKVTSSGAATKTSVDIFLSLEQGQVAIFTPEAETFKAAAQDELAKQQAWRRGILIFNGDPLQDVIAEVSRYTAINIVIADPSIADIPLGGRFKVGELEAILDVLEAGFGIKATTLDNGTIALHALAI